MKRFFATLLLAILVACGSAPVSVNGQLEAAYGIVDAYVQVTQVSLLRGRITADQAAAASARAKSAVGKIDSARAALKTCAAPTASTCTDYLSIMQNLQPSLYEFEAELRRQQGAAK
jgi:hypothetical protein